MRRSLLGIGVVLAMALSIPFAGSAGAVANGCAAPGGIAMFPNDAGGQSNLMIACTLTTATGGSSQFYKVEDFAQAKYHWGAGRVVTGNTNTTATLTLTAGSFFATDVNHPISGYQASTPLTAANPSADLASDVFIKSVTDATHAVLSAAATATHTGLKFNIENSDSRQITDGNVTIALTSLTSATANFKATDVGRTITGTDLAHGAKISSVTNATTVVMSAAATASSTTEQVSIGPAANQTTARFVHDVATTSASKTITSASANFQSWDVHLAVVGTNIPAGASIASVTNATTAVLSAAASATGSGGSLSIGAPNATAPKNGDTVLNLGAELDLNPGLVAGSDPCTSNTPEGFVITAAWQNPNAYAAGIAFGAQTDTSLNQPTIAQYVVPTSVVSFAGYIEQVKAGLAGESIAGAHYDTVFPFLPTSIAICPAPNAVGVASSFEYLGVAHSQSMLPSGLGSPSNVQIRYLADFQTATVSSTAFLHIRATSASTTDAFSFSKACTEQYPGLADYGCGLG